SKGVAIGLLSGFVGRLADRVGPAPLLTIGSLAVGIAYAGLALAAPMQSFWLSVLPFLSLSAIGLALVVSPLSTAVMTSVDEANTGSASGVNNAVSRVAGLFAVALMGLLAATIYNGSAGVTPGDYGLSSAATDLSAHNLAMTSAFQGVAMVASLLSFISAGVAWLMVRKTSDD
ncbi:MAG: MFS transporter, partial [Pseudomonadota bacterium]